MWSPAAAAFSQTAWSHGKLTLPSWLLDCAPGIEAVDSIVEKIEPVLATLVDINNELNDAITKVKDAVAEVTGAFKMELTQGTITDTVVLTVTKSKAEGDLKAVAAKPEVAKADQALAEALAQLYAALQGSTGAVLKVDGASLSCSDPSQSSAVAAFNEALKGLTAALGADWTVALSVNNTAAHGSRGPIPKVTARPAAGRGHAQ